MKEDNIRECLSKIIQLRFYWLSCHFSRGILLDLLDRNKEGHMAGGAYFFSREDPIPSFPNDWFLKLFKESGDTFIRKQWMTFLRRSIILNAQAEIEECLKNKGITLDDLNLTDEEYNAFKFLEKSRIVIFHTGSKKKQTGRSVEWEGIKIDNSGDFLKTKDTKIDLLLKTIIVALVKNVPEDKIVNQDVNMAQDIEIIKKIAERRGDLMMSGGKGSVDLVKTWNIQNCPSCGKELENPFIRSEKGFAIAPKGMNVQMGANGVEVTCECGALLLQIKSQ